jgi:hypothetical protein
MQVGARLSRRRAALKKARGSQEGARLSRRRAFSARLSLEGAFADPVQLFAALFP